MDNDTHLGWLPVAYAFLLVFRWTGIALTMLAFRLLWCCGWGGGVGVADRSLRLDPRTYGIIPPAFQQRG